MRLRLATRTSLVIVGLIVFIVVTLSGALFVQFWAVMSEMRRSNSDAMASALLEQAEKQGIGLTQFLAEAMTNPLYQYRMDVIYDLVGSTKDQKGVVYVYMYDEAGAFLYGGTEAFEAYGTRLKGPTRQAIAAGRSFTWIAENTLHVAAPVKIGSRVLGSVTVGVSLKEVTGDITEIESVLAGITKTGVANHIFATGVAAVVFAALGVFLSVQVARRLAHPIEEIARVTRRIGRGEYDLQVSVERSDEIGDLAAAFNRMVENLARSEKSLRAAQDALLRKERLAAIGQVTATVGHELRNPLGAIRTALAVVRKLARDEDPMMKESLAISERGIIRCDAIISDLLDFTRIRRLNREPTAIDRWLRPVVEEHGLAAPLRPRLELEAGIELPLDRERMRRVVVNVIDNACHAIDGKKPAGDRAPLLTVGTGVNGERLEIAVRDTGHGMAPEVAAKVFEPLFSTKAFGVGLGLPMVKQIMEQHGGGVEITSQEERGTEVVLWLPLANEAQRDAA
jgi:signal transduction histidine kinase